MKGGVILSISACFKYIKKMLLALLIATLLIVLTACKNVESKIMHFASYKTTEKVPYDIYFDDAYFNNPASEYNPHLASASACLALAGFSATSNGDFTNADVNAKELFSTLGFKNYLANPYGTSKPTSSSFGVFIASKSYDDYTLIGITVRGSGYLNEWASNFKLGNNEDFAEGFFEASEIYLNFLKKYIDDYSITGNIKIWTAGYSRGGAVVNLASGRIDDGLVEGKNIISEQVNYTKDDIYAYSFEPPAGKIVKSDDEDIFEKGENYSNIFSIINLNDPVPFVAPYGFSFIRYGTDMFLPDIITDLNYQDHIDLVKKRMSKLDNASLVGEYKLDKFKDESTISFLNKFKSPYINVTPYVYLNDLLPVICSSIGSKEEYVENLQGTLMELFDFLYSHISPKESIINLGIDMGKSFLINDGDGVVLYDLQNNIGNFRKDFEPLLFMALKKIDVNLTKEDFKKLTYALVSLFTGILFSGDGFVKLRSLINMENIGILGSAHIPEILLTHITSLDDNYDSSGLTVKNSFNIIRLSADSEFELEISGEKYVYFEDGNIVSKFVMKKEMDEYVIYIPSNTDFKINSNGHYSYNLYCHNNSYLNDRLIESVIM